VRGCTHGGNEKRSLKSPQGRPGRQLNSVSKNAKKEQEEPRSIKTHQLRGGLYGPWDETERPGNYRGKGEPTRGKKNERGGAHHRGNGVGGEVGWNMRGV